jgi:dynein heavy chain
MIDVMVSLLKFVEAKGFGINKFQSISLGQGQGPIATAMIKNAQKDGTWVVLQNCHLAVSWLPALEKITDDMSSNPAIHKDFRLWLTSYPSPKFPVSILQNGVKMTNEPPKGLRANLLRSYTSDPISDGSFYEGAKKQDAWEKLLFGLCYFHALVQERRSFGPLGWNIPYEFNESDLRISIRQLRVFLDEYEEIPFKAINYLTAETNHGGKVTDHFDRRLINNLLSLVYCPETVDDPEYKFTPSGLYHSAEKSGYNTFVDYIRGLPLNAEPEAFGIHENGDISRQLAETKTLLDSVLQTQEGSRSSGGGNAKSSDEILLEMTTDILSKVPAPFNIDDMSAKYPVNYFESLNTVLIQELLRFNRLVEIIISSLQNLQKAVKGLISMSTELEDMSRSMLVGKVPAMWSAKSYPSLKPLGGYIKDLCTRLQNFQKWCDQGPPKSFWISGFFFTQSFITGALQNYARKFKIPIDEIMVDFEVMPASWTINNVQSPEDGVYVYGFYLEGARWSPEEAALAESVSKVLYDQIPLVWFKPVRQRDFQPQSTYDCPVYKTSARRGVLSTTGHSTNYVITVRLPTRLPERHWINRGVALLLQLDD